MSGFYQFLPGTGRGTARRVVEGTHHSRSAQRRIPFVSRCAAATSPCRGGIVQ